ADAFEIFDMPADGLQNSFNRFLESVLPNVQIGPTGKDPRAVSQNDATYGSKQRRDDLPKIDPLFFGRRFEKKSPDDVLSWWDHEHILAKNQARKTLLYPPEYSFRSTHRNVIPLTACNSMTGTFRPRAAFARSSLARDGRMIAFPVFRS